MKNKLDYETWENALVAYSLREKEGNLTACTKILSDLAKQFPLPPTSAPPSTSPLPPPSNPPPPSHTPPLLS